MQVTQDYHALIHVHEQQHSFKLELQEFQPILHKTTLKRHDSTSSFTT